MAKFCAFGLKTIRIWNFREKIFRFTLENLHGKLIFWPFFLLFSRVPEAVGEFFASSPYFSLLRLGRGIFPAYVEFRRVEGESSPHSPSLNVWRTPWPLKGYPAPSPAGCPGGGSPRMVAKFTFFERYEVLENESIFQKYQHFSCQKNRLFLRKKFEMFHIFYKGFWLFSQNYFKNFDFYGWSL